MEDRGVQGDAWGNKQRIVGVQDVYHVGFYELLDIMIKLDAKFVKIIDSINLKVMMALNYIRIGSREKKKAGLHIIL